MKNEFVWTLEGYIRQYRMLAGVEGGDAFKAESLKGGSSYGRKIAKQGRKFGNV
jgi:hypothetical protein